MGNDHVRDRFLVEEIGDELIVYDREKHRAHHLNRSAAAVWRRCREDTNLSDLTATVRRELGEVIDEHLVRFVVDRLDNAALLPDGFERPLDEQKISRRQMLARAGVAAAFIPVVTSIVVPTPARAASGGGQSAPAPVVTPTPVQKPKKPTAPPPQPGRGKPKGKK